MGTHFTDCVQTQTCIVKYCLHKEKMWIFVFILTFPKHIIFYCYLKLTLIIML